jgi:hypothetical protein
VQREAHGRYSPGPRAAVAFEDLELATPSPSRRHDTAGGGPWSSSPGGYRYPSPSSKPSWK